MNFRILGSGAVVTALLIGLMISIAWAAGSPIDDPYSTANSQWNGTSILLERGFKPVKSDVEKVLSSPTAPSVVFILGPSREFTVTEADAIRGYLENGGLLVLADNFGSGNSLLELMGLPIRFDGRLLADTLFYSRQPNFPTIIDLPGSDLSSGIRELALSFATVLNVTNARNIRILATSTPFSFLDINQDGSHDPNEPKGAFPVLAELALGKGSIIVFTSPASFTNGMLDLADNNVLLENMLKIAPAGSALLDETHLTPSAFTPAKKMAKEMVLSMLNGGMLGSIKLGLAVLTIGIAAVRYGYRKPSTKEAETRKIVRSTETDDIDSILKLHPTWSRERLNYVKRELDVTRKWRQLRFEEE